MYPAEFAYQAPTTLAEAIQLLQSGDGEVKVLAGGQSLLPLMKLRFAEPSTLVDIGRISDLRGIQEEGNSIVIKAMTTYHDVLVSPQIARRIPLLIETIRVVGDRQVRARGTVGGSMAHADPAGDLPAAVLALDAEMTAMGPGGTRTSPARDFFVDILTTALQPGEVLTSVRLPPIDQPRTGSAYVKHRHPASGYAVVGVAAIVRLAEDGTCQSAQVGITGPATYATRDSAVEQALAGKSLTDATLADASSHAADGLDLMSDNYASSEFRAHLTRILTRHALNEAAARARGTSA